MRFDVLRLARFGHFTDRELVFSPPAAGESDLHLVIGANEAGKSTLRAAIVQFLFGMDHQSNFAFTHASPDLLLGAVLGGDDGRELQRLKGRKDTLRRVDGTVVPEVELARRLGGLDKAAYERDFALGHEALVSGGRGLLANQSDLSALLFEAASGIAEFAKVRSGVEERANGLWARDRRVFKKSRFAAAAQQLTEADRARRDSVTTGGAFDKLRRSFALAQEELAEVRRRCADLEQERHALVRMRTVARILARFDAVSAELGELEGRAQNETSLLEDAAQIEAFIDQVARTSNHLHDIDKRRVEARAEAQRAVAAAHAIGWDLSSPDQIAARLPPAVRRRDLAALAAKRPALEATLLGRTEIGTQATADLERAVAERDRLVVVTFSPELERALADARKLGDVGARRERLVAELRAAEAERDLRLADLAPWSGSREALVAMALVDEAEIAGVVDTLAQQTARLEASAEAIAEARRQVATREAKVAERRRQRAIVDRGELEAARRERDSIWERIRSGALPVEDAAVPFEAALLAADDAADRRFAGAEAITEIEHAETEIATLRAGVAADEAAREELQARRQQTLDAWGGRMTVLGLPGLNPDGYRTWLSARRRVLEQEPRVVAAATAMRDYDDRVAAAEQALGAALGASDSPAGIADLIERAEECRRGALRFAADSEQKMRAVEELERKAQQARTALGEIQAEVSQWDLAFARAVDACGLPAGLGVEAAHEAIEQMAVIESALTEIRKIESERIAAMEADLAAVVATAALQAERLPEEERSTDPATIARQLKARLTAQRSRQDQATSLRRQLDELRLELAEACEGHDLANLREQLSVGDADSRRLREEEVARALQESEGDREHAAAAAEAARAALAAVSGGDVDGSAAARAEEDRQSAIAELSATAVDYVETWLAARLLRWAIERYRTENQSPLLAKAAAAFRELTGASFVDLVVDVDANPPVLRARRADGNAVGLEGLSDGSRDQLFLALRLAAIDIQLARVEPLPFIADDLFVNFDDERAAAGFRALAELGRRTQVFYLSHHEHLIDVARSVLGDDFHVHRLHP